MTITPRQREVLAMIAAHCLTEGRPPTLREIGNALGIKSTNAVNDHLQALAKKGYITRNRLISRGIRVTEVGAATI